MMMIMMMPETCFRKVHARDKQDQQAYRTHLTHHQCDNDDGSG